MINNVRHFQKFFRKLSKGVPGVYIGGRRFRAFGLASFVFLGATRFPSSAFEIVYPAGVPEKRLITEFLWNGISRLPRGQRPRVILVLGGGGARGLSHIGVLKVFQEERIPVDEIVGVSVGALIGSLYASGLSVKEIETMAKDVGWDKLTDLSRVSMARLMFSDVLLSSENMESYLAQHIGQKTFEQLNIPFVCTATDLRTGERVVFREGSVALAARASATIPAFFRPVEFRQRYLVDGGLVDNLPTDLASVESGDIVIGILPVAEAQISEMTSVLKGLLRSIEIQRDAIIDRKKKVADFLIEPNVGSVTFIDLGRYQECIDAGEIAARKKALDLKGLIINRTLDRMQGRGGNGTNR